MEEQVIELRSSTLVETNDFSIEHGLAVPGAVIAFRSVSNELNG